MSTSQVTTRKELLEQQRNGPILVLTVDSLLYRLETFTFTDSFLIGTGALLREGGEHFEGAIPWRRIAFIEGAQSNPWKMVWVLPMVAGVAGGLVNMFEEPDRFDMYYHSSGSCPFIYSYDGKEFQLEAEAFGTSISKALEAKTFSLLPGIVSVENRATIRIGNERPETHLLNSARLFVADAGKANAVVLDVANNLWPLDRPVPPVVARDHQGLDILPGLTARDNVYWKSDLAEIAPLSGFQDQLELEFLCPEGASEATLVIHAINSELINEVYRSVGEYLGDATLQFYHSLEHDQDLQERLRAWTRECGLRVEVSDGTHWTEAVVLPPEANVAPFSRAVRLTGLGDLRGRLHVRLSSLTDVWRIDAVAMDVSPAHPLTLRPLELLSVTASDSRDWEEALGADDSSYALILPGQHLDCVFRATQTRDMNRPVFVVAAQGYLYEWFPTAPERSTPLADLMSRTDRIAALKILLAQKDLFLPPIYAVWRKSGAR